MQIKDLTFEPYLSQESIQQEIVRLAEDINSNYAEDDPIFIAVLNGAFIFMADLARHISIPSEITFVKVKSYEQLQSTGEHREFIGLEVSVTNRHIIVVEDIVDSGNTIQFLIEKLQKLNPASVSVATLLFKPDALQHTINVDYVGFQIPNDFVVGYGLDYDGYGRNLPDIYKLKS